MRTLKAELHSELLANAEVLIQRYSNLRKRLNLPRLEPTAKENAILLDFVDVPPPLELDVVTRNEIARAIGWLATLEREWGENLGEAFYEEELSFDQTRQVHAVGPGLFVRANSRVVFNTLAVRCHSDWTVTDSGAMSYVELAAVLAETVPVLQPYLEPGITTEDRIRSLRDLAQSRLQMQDYTLALTHGKSALELQPGSVSFAEIVAECALRLNDLEVFQEVEDILIKRGLNRFNACYLLALKMRETGRESDAITWAQKACALDESDERGWRLLALLANKEGQTVLLREALEQLSTLGHEVALVKLRAKFGVESSWPFLGNWKGNFSSQIGMWRLEQLHQEEKLGALLRLFGDIGNSWNELSAVHLNYVFEAASRLPGKLLTLRRMLWKKIESREASADLVELFVRTCIRDQLWDEVLNADRIFPGVLGKPILAKAYLSTGAYGSVINMTTPLTEHTVGLRFQALVRKALTEATPAGAEELEETTNYCADMGLHEVLRQELSHLRRSAPGQPITRQLENVLTQSKGLK